ncbi:tryptophan-rich sensory protein [Microvirga sp. BT689]|uniref:TspO/MBR family protein n=1 Tax=Microvirga arvi TaxID=2778731 RepID=UPI00195128A0|nr:TspO/MBR family protein [Microvirga arvi]MBM6579775.1 tryptophan-rich sensory protein [Microvirga arvi]
MHTDQTAPGSHAMPPLPRFLVAVLPVVAVAVSASLITQPNIPTWYAGLEKPAFTPPNWAFPVAWTLLYALMAYALWRILSLPETQPGRAAAIVAFFVQLVLNGMWSFAFFGGRSPMAGLIVIAALIAAILATIRAFWRLDRPAALLLVPYLAWVAYATLLNGTIWRLNG